MKPNANYTVTIYGKPADKSTAPRRITRSALDSLARQAFVAQGVNSLNAANLPEKCRKRAHHSAQES